MLTEPYTNFDFNHLTELAQSRPFDRGAVTSFFTAFDRLKEHSIQNRIIYLQLKFLKEKQKWKYLNEIALIYLRQNKRFIAFNCLLESLFLNPWQPEIFALLESIQDCAAPRFPNQLQKNSYKVSVIMATYKDDRKEMLKEAIKSVLKQKFQDFELIVANDGGTDEIRNIIDSFNSAKIKYFKIEESRGHAFALNEAIKRANGKYIAYLDDDDIYYPDHLEILVHRLDNTDYKFVYTSTHAIKGSTENGRFKKRYTQFKWQKKFNTKTFILDNYISNLSVMHQKNIFKEVGFFREDLCNAHDWEWWLRCALTFNFLHINEFTGEYRIREDNSWVNNLTQALFLKSLIKNYYAFHQGDIARIKYYLHQGQADKPAKIYENIVAKYDCYFKTRHSIKELIELSLQFNDTNFQRKLFRDYLYFAPKSYLKEAMHHKAKYMLLNNIWQLPIAILKKMLDKIFG